MSAEHLRCTELVDSITDYLDSALDGPALDRIEDHLSECPDCAAALAQFRRTIELAGRLTDHDVESVSPSTRERLMTAFRAART